jgi:hypothetical protein
MNRDNYIAKNKKTLLIQIKYISKLNLCEHFSEKKLYCNFE